MGYPEEWMLWAKDELKNIVYDDYDRLIQLCDKFFEMGDMVSLEQRTQGIVSRYNLPLSRQEKLLKEGLTLKQYFDSLCGRDVYDIFDIKA